MNLNFIKVLFSVLIHPTETLRKERENASIEKGIAYFLASILIPLILWGLIGLASSSKTGYLGFKVVFSQLFEQLITILFILLPSLIVFHLVVYLLAKFFKGTGNIEEQSYLVSIAIFPILFVLVLIGGILYYAFFFIFILVLFIAIILISYLSTIALLEAHEFKNVSMLIKLATTIGLFILILVVLYIFAGLSSIVLRSFDSPTGAYQQPPNHEAYNALAHAV